MVFFKNKKSATKFTRHTILEEDLFIRRGPGMTPWGEFPRRVVSGEQLFAVKNCHILSPINGIARLNETGVSITQDGILQSKTEREMREYSFDELSAKMIAGSVVALDYNCQPLVEQFRQALENGHDIILSPFARTGEIDFAGLIRAELWAEFLQFKTNLMTIFRDSVFKDYIAPGNLEYRYPANMPEYFISTYGDKDMKSDHILYLGAETIYHLLKAIYHKIPFFQRYISILMVDNAGYTRRMNEAFLVYNGQNLNYIKECVPEKFRYFTWNNIYDNNEIIERDEPFYIDIFKHSSFIFFEKKQERREICLDCGLCNYMCPVSAGPYALVGEPEKFRQDVCIECSICTVHCPGGMNMRKKIQEIRNGRQADLY